MLGALVRDGEADMRTIRAEVAAWRDEVGRDRGVPVRARAELVRAAEARIMDRPAALEAIVEHRGHRGYQRVRCLP